MPTDNNGQASRLWPLSRNTNDIPDTIEDYSHVLAITINKDQCLRKGAKTFSDFKQDSKGVGESWQVLFQSFLKLCEDLTEKVYTQKQKLPRGTDFQPMRFFLESVYKPVGENGKKEFVAYTFWCFIMKLPVNEEEEEDIQEDEMSDIEENAHRNLQIPQSAQAQQQQQQNRKFNIDPNVRWKFLIESISRGHTKQDKSAVDSKSQTYYDANSRTKRQHHKWKKLDGKHSLLSTYFDMNMGYDLSSEHKSLLYTRDLKRKDNLFSATSMFNIAAAFANRGDKNGVHSNVNDNQNLNAFYRYFPSITSDDLEDPLQFARMLSQNGVGGGVFQFPDPRYVMNIDLTDITVKNIIRKLLPDKQKVSKLDASAAIPKMIYDFQRTLEGEDFKMTIDDLMNDMMNVSRRLNNRETPREIEENDELNENPQQAFRNSIAMIMVASGLEKVLYDLRESSMLENPVDQRLGPSLSRRTPEFNPDFIKRAAGHIEESGTDDSTTFNLSSSYISEYHELRDIGIKNLRAIEDVRTQVEIQNPKSLKSMQVISRKMMLLIQKHMIQLYDERCRSEDSNVSVYEKSLIKAIESGGLKALDKPTRKLSLELTVAGSLEQEEYIRNARTFLAKRPRELSLCTQYCWSVWDMYLDRCRLNFFMTGPGDAGKSWTLEEAAKRMNVGTVESESYRSEKGEATMERNRNGVVILWHEIDPAMLIPDKTGNSLKAPLWKNRTTSNVMEVRRLVKDVNGKFVTEVTRCEVSAVFLGACNFNLKQRAEEAAQTRAHINPIEVATYEYSVLEMELLNKIQDTNEKNEKVRLIGVYRKVQIMIFEIFRLTYIGGLNETTDIVPLLTLTKIERAFKKNGLTPPSYRTFDRTIQLSRLKCIRTWIELLFHTRGALFEGRDVETWMYSAFDRVLCVSFENTVAAIGEQIDMYVDQWEVIIKKALRKWYFEGTKNAVSLRKAKHMVEMDPIVLNTDNDKERRTGTRNYNYVTYLPVRGGKQMTDNAIIGRVAKNLKGWIDQLEDVDYHPSADTVYNVLERWHRTSFNSKKYDLKPGDAEKGIAEDIVADDKSVVPVNAVRIDNGMFNFHYSLIDNKTNIDTRSMIVEVIEEIGNAKSQPPRVMPFDCDSRNNFVRNVIRTQGNPNGSSIRLESDIYIDEFSQRVLGKKSNHSFRVINIEEDIDMFAMRQRNASLYISELPIDPEFEKINIFDFVEENQEDDNDFDGWGYFLGEKINANVLGENYKPTAFQIHSIYKNLDSKYKNVRRYEALEGENYRDFDIDEKYWECDGIPIWEGLGIRKSQWKLFCWTPFFMNLFLNKKYYRGENRPEEFDFEAFAKEIKDRQNEVNEQIDKQYFSEELAIPKNIVGANSIFASREYDEDAGGYVKRSDAFDCSAIATEVMGNFESKLSKRKRNLSDEILKKRKKNTGKRPKVKAASCTVMNMKRNKPMIVYDESTSERGCVDPLPNSDEEGESYEEEEEEEEELISRFQIAKWKSIGQGVRI